MKWVQEMSTIKCEVSHATHVGQATQHTEGKEDDEAKSVDSDNKLTDGFMRKYSYCPEVERRELIPQTEKKGSLKYKTK